ncbi:hypothetical protein ABZ419_11115 [Streptomyces cinnamoneus]|uniref:hypothetical protein n=1 Tax=Streptomyces cinnamoneus TaxID=53446 RepID=UPI0033F2D811
MSIESTEPSNEAQRRGHMAALAASEHVGSVAPSLPMEITVRCAPWGEPPEIRAFFYQSAEGVRALAQVLGFEVTTESRGQDGTELYVSATGSVRGIEFEAWTLVDSAAAVR